MLTECWLVKIGLFHTARIDSGRGLKICEVLGVFHRTSLRCEPNLGDQALKKVFALNAGGFRSGP